VEQIQFLRYSDPVHKFSISYPSTWNVVRSENPAASIIMQITCDSDEESYKRLSVAWDDVSWSTITAEAFGRNVAAQLPQLVPGASLTSHGPYDPARRLDGAYQIVYKIADPLDASELQLFNVVVVSQGGGRRRAYTITFGADADAFADALRLARHMVDSFQFDDPGPRGGGGAGGGGVGGVGAGRAPASSLSSPHDDGHVNVWERDRDRLARSSAGVAAGGPGGAADAAPSYPSVVTETPPRPAEAQWTAASIPQAGLAFSHPAPWASSGIGADESLGFAPVATHAVRRWCVAYACDRREAVYKHMSVVCVDVTPCFDLLTARAARKGGNAEPTQEPAAVLLQYLLYRYRSDIAEAEALANSQQPRPPPLNQPGDDILKQWVDVFAQRWPVTCRVASPLSASNTAGGGANAGANAMVLAPHQMAITDQRVVATSRLLKVTGWLRTSGPMTFGGAPSRGASMGGGGGGGGGRSGSDARHHGSAYSSLSMEGDAVPAEGLLLQTTSAVLVGLHDAIITLPVPVGRQTAKAAGPAAPTQQKRVFGHIVTFGTGSDAFHQYEGFAKYVFQSLEAVSASR
jgi:hypothetical protein